MDKVRCPHLRRHDLPAAERAAHGRVPGLRSVIFIRCRGTAATGTLREAEATGIAPLSSAPMQADQGPVNRRSLPLAADPGRRMICVAAPVGSLQRGVPYTTCCLHSRYLAPLTRRGFFDRRPLSFRRRPCACGRR